MLDMNKSIIFLSVVSVFILSLSVNALAVQQSSIPSWIKNTAKWWSEGSISDDEFTKAIQYMLDVNILHTKTSQANQLNDLRSKLFEAQNNYNQVSQELNNLKSKYDSLQMQYNSLLQGKQSSPSPATSVGTTLNCQSSLAGLTKDEIQLCANTNPFIKGLITGQIKFYIDPLPDYAAPGVDAVIQKFSDSINGKGPPQLRFQRVDNPNQADIQISWIKNWGSGTLGLTVFKSVVQVGLGKDSCYGEWQAFDPQSVYEIFTHEFGHSIGYKHSSDPNNIMYHYTDTKFSVDYDKSITFNRGYVQQIPLCGNHKYLYQVSTDNKYNGVDVLVSPHNTDYNGMVSGQEPYYLECSKKNMVSYSNTCTVENGSFLWIYNHNDEPTNSTANQVTVKIINMDQRPLPNMTYSQSDQTYDTKTIIDIWKMFH